MPLSTWLRLIGKRTRDGAPMVAPDAVAEVPATEDEIGDDVPRVCIVTPVFNGADYIDETIHSVLSQAGDFVLHYHVQDGGSTDDTMARVEHWRRRTSTLPLMCRKLVFTCACERDGGMYDAINKAFARALPSGDDIVMGWINADDRIAPGALSAITAIRATFPDVRLLGGRISLIDQAGAILGVHGLIPFSQRCMRAGLYDGRARNFIMQEGTFWCSDLWRKVGGLDTRFRLAGDWDFWRRLADHAAYVSADTILGFHRRRPGQLSADMNKYYAEVDATLDQVDDAVLVEGEPSRTRRDLYTAISLEHERAMREPARFRESGHGASAVRYNLSVQRWERVELLGLGQVAHEVVTPAGTTETIAVRPTKGLKAPEGPYPEHGLLGMVRWMDGRRAIGEVIISRPGRYRLMLRCRSWSFGQSVALLADGLRIARLAVKPHEHDRDLLLSVETTLEVGRRELAIELDQPDHDQRFLLLIDWWIERLVEDDHEPALPVPKAPIGLVSRNGSPPIGAWPAISLVLTTCNQGHLLRDALNAIVRQAYPALELIVVDFGSTDQTAFILHEFAAHITRLIIADGASEENSIEQGLCTASGSVLACLRAEFLVANEALHAVGHAFLTADCDIVSGVFEVFDDSGAVRQRVVSRGSGKPPMGSFFTRSWWERDGRRAGNASGVHPAVSKSVQITVCAPLLRCRDTDPLVSDASDPLPSRPIEIDTVLFVRGDRQRARRLLGLPHDAFIVLAVAASHEDAERLRIVEGALASLNGLLLVLVRGENGDAPLSNARLVGHLDSAALIALHLQAADVYFDQDTTEASDLMLLRAAACEVPGVAIAGSNASRPIIDGLTGMLVDEAASAALAAAFVTLYTNAALRRQMGVHARLHAMNEFATTALSPALARGALEKWYPLRGLEREPAETCTDTIWRTTGADCVVLLPAAESGLHTLHFTICGLPPDTLLTMTIEGGDRQQIMTGAEADATQVVQFGVALTTGWNRAVIEAAAGLRIKEIRWWPGTPRPEGTVDLLDSFGPLEGPYPEHGLLQPIRWVIGHRCRLRIFARAAGRRALELRVRNNRPDQMLTVFVNDSPVASFQLDQPSLISQRCLIFEAELYGGPNDVRIDATRVLESQDDLRPIAFIYDDLVFAADSGCDADGAQVVLHRCPTGFAAMVDSWENML